MKQSDQIISLVVELRSIKKRMNSIGVFMRDMEKEPVINIHGIELIGASKIIETWCEGLEDEAEVQAQS